MKNIILQAKGLCKSFAHNGGQVHILSHVDFDLYEGDFTVIMGASGSGKSTMLYALSGMDRATAGTVMYKPMHKGKDIDIKMGKGMKMGVDMKMGMDMKTGMDMKMDIDMHMSMGMDLVTMKEKELAKLRHTDFGFIFQQMHLVSNLTLFENVAVSGYLNKDKSAAEVKDRTNELLSRMGISHIKTHLPSQVSGGEQQRCAIARAVVNKPKLLFADEPTGALNRSNTAEVLNLLTELNSNGQSILMVTHDLKAALRATRLLYLEDGKFIGELNLPPFLKEEEKSRETQVNAWLSSMKW